eukprot:TRINITY_DN7649_c0_g1_i1.p1 TRINITY_DN7649_c0_g1~~TRINITY_DN7649_c0_g1_i1.p1  ORF type:complete len:150 (-),score=25.57 TRINITY_DN7649_c0_g1_i1:31-480(-)
MAFAPQHRRTLFVAGLDDQVTEAVLRAAFIPFGDLVDVMMPLDHKLGKHKGFGFVEYEYEEDLKAALDNMNDSELYGRVLTVNVAKPTQLQKTRRPIWESDDYLKKDLVKEGEDVDPDAPVGIDGGPVEIDDKERARIEKFLAKKMQES